MKSNRIKQIIYAVMAIVLKIVLGAVYAALKWLPSRNKVVFLSRQDDQPGLDFLLLRDSLLSQDPQIQTVMITRKLERNLLSALRFAWYTAVSMYHLATASVCVLDTYWPAVSMLKHKKTLTVIQLWHAAGKIKQSGYQTLDKDYGRGKAAAQWMDMHKGYDVVVAGGKAMNGYYCASFGVQESQLLNVGLPRIDYLLENSRRSRALLEESYPELRGKTVILYAPTFRRGTVADYSSLIASFEKEEYALIIKPHPYQIIGDPEALERYRYGKLTTMQVLGACDVVITDYSAISFEAAVLRKPIYFYLFDYQNYLRNNGVNIDPYTEMPDNVYEDPEQLVNAIKSGTYDMDALTAFRKRYLPEKLGEATRRLTKLIIDCVKDGKHEGIRQNLHREAEAAVSVDH